jgi:tetratricopeptide (TPR) repeat protein
MTTSVESSAPLPKGANLARAIALFHQGRYDRMEAEARAELARDPDDPEALTWLGLALFKLQREEEALAVLADAIRLKPDHADAHYVRARVLWWRSTIKWLAAGVMATYGESLAQQAREMAQQCEEALAEAMRLNPDSTEYLEFLASLRREQGRFDEGLATAERGLVLDPQHAGCLTNRALLLAKLGRLDEARRAFEMALERAPESADLHLEFGKLLLDMDAHGRALEHLREALRLNPSREAEVRPLIAEAMKRHSLLYDWIGKSSNLVWVMSGTVGLLIAALVFTRDSEWILFKILNEELLPGVGYILLFFGLLLAIDPVHSLYLCGTPSGRLMLSETERRQAYAVAVCLAVALIAGVGFLLASFDLLSGITGWAHLFLFALFWISPIVLSLTLYPPSLRRFALACVGLSVVLVGLYLLWCFFGTPALLEGWYGGAVVLLGGGYFLLLVPNLLSRSASEFSSWRPRPRQRAVLVVWSITILLWFLVVAFWFAAYFFLENAPLFYAIRGWSKYAAVPWVVVLVFEERLLAWLAARFGEKPAS